MSAMTDDLTDRRVDIMLAGVRGAHATESGWHYGQDAYERAIFRAAYAAGMRAGIERAAAFAETWGGKPPSPLGRRARLARDIRALVEGKP